MKFLFAPLLFVCLPYLSTGQTSQIDPDYVPTGYLVTSGVLSGTGMAYSIIGVNQLNQDKPNWAYPAIGISSGLTQITLGAVYYNRDFGNTGIIYRRNQNVSLANMGFGSLMTAFNTYMLVRTLKRKTLPTTSLSLVHYPTQQNRFTLGINLTKRF